MTADTSAIRASARLESRMAAVRKALQNKPSKECDLSPASSVTAYDCESDERIAHGSSRSATAQDCLRKFLSRRTWRLLASIG